jgi:hypothetical protein
VIYPPIDAEYKTYKFTVLQKETHAQGRSTLITVVMASKLKTCPEFPPALVFID